MGPKVLYVLGAWIFYGAYPVPFKSPAALKADTDPFVFQCFKSTCVFLTSWLILTWRPFTFTYLGFVGAACWVPAGLLFISAVKFTSIAFATPIAGGFSVAVSFCWGKFYFHEKMKNSWLTLAALGIIIVGMLGISYAVNYEKRRKARAAKKAQAINDQEVRRPEIVNEHTYLDIPDKRPLISQPQASSSSNNTLGVVLAVSSAIFGGSMNVPLKNAPPDAHGIQYVISFGIGSIAVTAVLTIIYILVRFFWGLGLPKANFRVSFVPGVLAGCLWSAGNICQIYTILTYGMLVGSPLVQCNMMVAGLWGVFYYNEAPKVQMKGLFVTSCLVLLGGVALLSLYG